MILSFYVRFSTRFGQSLYLSANLPELGNDNLAAAVPMQYFNEEYWQLQVKLPDASSCVIEYRYILREKDGYEIVEWGDDRIIDCDKYHSKDLTLIDTWNHAGQVENAFFTQPFQEVLFPKNEGGKTKQHKSFTHELKVKAPLLQANEVVCLCGSGTAMGEWNTKAPILLVKENNWWVARLNMTDENFPIAYKYGIYNNDSKAFQNFELGSNRVIAGSGARHRQTIVHDGFVQMPYPNWRAAGLAVPVFSLRSEKSFGTGEFSDIKLLVDWAKACGLKLIQLLPINDTTATHTWTDSYPYAAISAFALHPMYLNLAKVAGKEHASIIKSLETERLRLNQLPEVDYEAVNNLKFETVSKIYHLQKATFRDDTKYFEFFDLNRHWLVPYAVFCYLRDKYHTADYTQWPEHAVYNEETILQLADSTQSHYDEIALHYFIQYHLHLQLKEATAYAHKNGIIVKGDLPIGIYRYGCDAWVAPALYNMDAQAGAPPDDFAIKGQNWGFPTYNWKKMEQDGYAWWRRRFEQMSDYFDAFRIDHILGFFRIWSIPTHAVEGIMGRFVPAIPVSIREFHQQNISFEYHRFCEPYIPEYLVQERFGLHAGFVKDNFLEWHDGSFKLKQPYDTQRKVEQYFSKQPDTDFNRFIKQGLFDIISNVILFEEEGSQMQRFHFRINMDSTISFRDLDDYSKQKLKELYIDYFYRRQDDYWMREAMHKLPELKRTTNMLVCGEDLGMMPACVPHVMEQLGMLSLEIQRMPKDINKEFFHPADAPYLSVVTPATHDMSTIRGWWEEDIAKTQRFYNYILGKYGTAPYFCEAWINRDILIQHLYSPAMWCIFQVQDILGMNNELRRNNPNDERINIPANPRHYWRYRMHLNLEALISETPFNSEFRNYVTASGR
ncbi:MAG TPA: 4-alpha-glucanotransferase [Ferruginibacter sp.]|nr:4-alpha-glucanotransferase [Ferruginibacter sp.]HMP21168.1 4-alpha-glucanotransferase [Ferruginibacter sp.]